MLSKEAKLFLVLAVVLAFLLIPTAHAAHYIIGFVNNSIDGANANGQIITLWNPSNGLSDNVTDTIGPTGLSGADNFYLIDCELLSDICVVGDTLNVKVFNSGNNQVTETASVVVTGFGFDAVSNLRINSLPNTTLVFPSNNSNVSTSSFNLLCNSTDSDSNLANVTLYGNWSGGWHANTTLPTTGGSNVTNFSVILPIDGRYSWSCLATDNLSISTMAQQNWTFTLDSSAPNITSIYANVSANTCGTTTLTRVNCTFVLDEFSPINSVIIQSISPFGLFNTTASPLSPTTYYADILLNQTGDWRFNCIANDTLGHTANLTSQNYEVNPLLADLAVYSSDIGFSNIDPIENSIVTINSTVFNEGCTDSGNFVAAFYNGDPNSNGRQINGNITLSIVGLSNTTINVTWNAEIGDNNIYVFVDFNNSITEHNETNNLANTTLNVDAWQVLYGNVTLDKILANSQTTNISIWQNETYLVGNIFITDTENSVDWNSLLAIGRNTTNGNTTNDFSEIDSFLNMTSFVDSVSNTFTSDGAIPLKTESFLIYQSEIPGVPVVNSTSSGNFITGILWDSSDDTNGEFSTTDKEDLVFVGKINNSAQGEYGTYDYEIKIPARLREYRLPDTSDVFIYFDLN